MAPRLSMRSLAQLQRHPMQQATEHHFALPLRPTPTTTTTTTTTPGAGLPFLPQTTTRGVKYGWSTAPPRGKPTRFNQVSAGLPVRTAGPAAALERKRDTTPVRSGLLATKKGMTAFFSRKGTRFPCTVLQLDQCQVLAAKTRASNGYWAVQVGSQEKRPVTTTAPMLGYFEAKGVAPKQHLAEFKVRGPEGLLPVGVTFKPDWFHIGQWVDVRSNTRGMGFAGGMKKHGFSGQEKSHGNSLNHRTIGTTGPSQGGGSRVHPGKKMPGRMGNERVTVQNLSVLKVDNELGIIVVKGAVGGPKGAIVQIQDAVKKPDPEEDWIANSRRSLEERHPHAAEHLEAARVRHLELKELRQQGRIEDIMKLGLQAGVVEAASVAEATAEPEVSVA